MAEERVEAERERSGKRVEPGAGHARRGGQGRQRTEAGAQDADGRAAARHERVGTRAVEADFDLDDSRPRRRRGQPGGDDGDRTAKRAKPQDQAPGRGTRDNEHRPVRRVADHDEGGEHSDRDEEGEEATADRQEDHPVGDLPQEHLSARDAARAALLGLSEVIENQPVGVTEVSPRHDGWIVSVEVVELQRLPSSTDIMALYEAELDMDGTLRSYRRIKRYARGRGDSEDG